MNNILELLSYFFNTIIMEFEHKYVEKRHIATYDGLLSINLTLRLRIATKPLSNI